MEVSIPFWKIPTTAVVVVRSTDLELFGFSASSFQVFRMLYGCIKHYETDEKNQ